MPRAVNNFGKLPPLIRLRLCCQYLLHVRLDEPRRGLGYSEGYAPVSGTEQPTFVLVFRVDLNGGNYPRNSVGPHLCYCLGLLEPTNPRPRWDNLHGLALLPTENQGECKRVGTFKPRSFREGSVDRPNDKVDEQTAVINLVGGDSVAEFAEVTEQEDGSKQYFVDLV